MIAAELKRIVRAFSYSCDGLVAAFKQDAPFRTEILLSTIIVPLGFYLGDDGIARSLLIGSWVLVLITELLNCGLEALTDYATKMERHDLAKKTKDVGSAAVLLALINCIVIWICILILP